MVHLATFLWDWLATALVLGLATGWISVVQRGKGLSTKLARWLALVAAILVGLALGRVVPGRLGYWLDLFLVMAMLYLAGCTVGSLLRNWVVSRSTPVP
jgi:hypothetical protein